MMMLVNSLRAALAECHDVVDGDDSDRPQPAPNWAMQATSLLDEIEALIPADIKADEARAC